MKEILGALCGFTNPEIKKLNGYYNANYLINNQGKKYIFKTYLNEDDTADILSAENDTLVFLQKTKCEKYPSPIPFLDGSTVADFEMHGKKIICRMLSFIGGEFLGDVAHSSQLFKSFGSFLGEMNIKLQSYTNYTIQSRQMNWDIQHLNLNRAYIADIPNARDRSVVHYFFQQFEENVLPVLPTLRKGIIHNDANEWNVLCTNDKVSGIIDFGDLVYSPLINELAVAITYGCYDKDDPLKWASSLVEGYHEVLALQEKELSVLYYLIAAQLCISVCNSAKSRKEDPSNEYAFSSEKNAWKMMHRWLAINPLAAKKCFFNAARIQFPEVKSVIEIVNDRYQFISPILSLSYSKPIHMDRAAFQYMYDVSGNAYLDAYNNIPHVGHSHPRVVEAGQRQMARLNTNTRYLYDQLSEYAEKLLSHFPDSLSKVYFVNSGSAASDLAIRLAQAHTGYKNMMVMEHGYHGNTQNGMDISDYKFSHKAGSGKKEHILKTAIPDTYRGEYKGETEDVGRKYAQKAIQQLLESEEPLAAFISEPIVGCGGQVPLANGYLKTLYPEIRKQGGVCISDEVQTGFGRLGDHFWGYEAHDVVPDIVILGKPMGNGHPIGAVVTTTDIAESLGKGVEFFSSFGGNPVSCAIGSAVLDVIKDETLQSNAKIVGDYYQSLLRGLKDEYDCIGDVRGSGLFIGVEIVKDKETQEPNHELAAYIKNEMRNRNILISTDGPSDSVLKTKPPLCFTKENAELVTSNISDILRTNIK
jgi:4-aminobutyrate aminotransferase-like enzyme/thiamine kinase-like enzyme